MYLIVHQDHPCCAEDKRRLEGALRTVDIVGMHDGEEYAVAAVLSIPHSRQPDRSNLLGFVVCTSDQNVLDLRLTVDEALMRARLTKRYLLRPELIDRVIVAFSEWRREQALRD